MTINNPLKEDSDSYIPSLKAIVFDFDGTLADSFPMFLAVFTSEMEKNFVVRKETIHELTQNAFLSEIEKGNERQKPNVLLLKVFYSVCRSLGMRRYSALLRTFYSAYKIKKHYSNIELFSGAKELLEEFHKQGIILILVTHSSKKNVLKILEKHKLQSLFNIVLDRSDIGANKTEGIIRALQALGVDPEHALAIGDLPADIMEAKSAGVKAVAVATGPVDKERLKLSNPDLIIDSLDELKDLVKTNE